MKNKVFKRIFSRFPLTALIIILMFVALYLISVYGFYYLGNALVALFPALEEYTEHMEIGFEIMRWIIVLIAVLHCANRDMVPETKIPWLLCITIMNLFGVAIYVVFSWHRPSRKERRLYRALFDITEERAAKGSSPEELRSKMGHWSAVSVALSTANPSAAIHAGTKTEYFPVGEKFRDRLLGDLEHAEKYILLEYFIIEEGKMWNTMLELLIDRVKSGVEVRVIYDDAGCFKTLPKGYDDYLRSLGIRVVRFNKFIPTLNTYMNHRNHRKICVVDGNIGFMGGINLADEYINHKVRFGHWKDTGVRLHGPGVSGMTMMFLQMWEYANRKPEPDVDRYMATESRSGDGYVQPFYDSPMDDNNVGEAAYMQIINRARRYVYITTPYLALDNEMVTALTVATQSGIDVRIITPGIPDKKLVFLVTRSYYQQLLRAGVRIYEYRPGFIHSKMIVSDDEVGIVGTMNMDFRSFFLHFECGTVLYGGATVREIRADIEQTMGISREIDLPWVHRTPWLMSLFASLLRLFAPLL